jgi:predicted FMN-binding regulatory protein PaiB
VVVDRVEAKAKLSQNRPVADRRGVEADLEARGGRAADVAALMRGPLGGAPDGG